MKLEDLINSLEKSAGIEGTQAAEENKKEEDKNENKKGSTDSKEKVENKEEGGQEKSAAFKSGEQLAKEIMEKVAATQIQQTQGEEMNKQASDAGKALAQALLTKLAGVGDQNTTYGYAEGAVPNKTQQDLASEVAEHNAIIQATPGTDGAGNGGTVNQIFDAIVADAQARGVVNYGGQTSSAAAEGARNATQVPNQVEVAGPEEIGDGQEKVAAVSALVESGIDFDDAVSLVKAASDELDAEHATQVKQAALGELINSGVDFDLAVSLVRQLS